MVKRLKCLKITVWKLCGSSSTVGSVAKRHHLVFETSEPGKISNHPSLGKPNAKLGITAVRAAKVLGLLDDSLNACQRAK